MFGRIDKKKKIPGTLDTPQGRISYLLRYSPKRRTMLIQIDEHAQVQVVVPSSAHPTDIQRFLLQKSHWIIAKIKELTTRNFPLLENSNEIESRRKDFTDGQEFLFLGKKIPLRVQEDSRSFSTAVSLSFDGSKFQAAVPSLLTGIQREAQIKERFLIWYQYQAKEILAGRVFHYTRIMGVGPKEIAIKKHKRIWGSCNYHKQTIHLNWQIVMSPVDVLDYVIVHELCHLRVPNHSKAFWRSVEAILPDYKQRRLWLKVNQRQMILPT